MEKISPATFLDYGEVEISRYFIYRETKGRLAIRRYKHSGAWWYEIYFYKYGKFVKSQRTEVIYASKNVAMTVKVANQITGLKLRVKGADNALVDGSKGARRQVCE